MGASRPRSPTRGAARARRWTTAIAAAAGAALLLWGRAPALAACAARAATCDAYGLDAATVCAFAAAADAESAPPRRAAPVPPIVHQSWKTADVPARFVPWRASWAALHPGWEMRLWTDESNAELVRERYPWLERAYDRLQANICRADLARALYMHAFGGVYADLDTWCLRSNTNLTAGRGGRATLAEMGPHADDFNNVPNAWMASAPGRPFWTFFARVVAARAPGLAHRRPEDVTGPIALYQALQLWRCLGRGDVDVLPPGRVFVKDWTDEAGWPRFEAACAEEKVAAESGGERCLAEFPDAHVLTYWAHTWEQV
jgi:hypothetical protein